MKRGYIILISGAVLLVAGIIISAVWAVQFAGSFLRDNTIVAQTSVDAGKSVDTRINVDQIDRPVSLAIGIDQTQTQLQPPTPSSAQTPATTPSSDLRLKEEVTDPNGRVVSSNEFSNSFFTSFKPEVTGVHTVTISNLGARTVSVNGAFGYMPFIGPDSKPNFDNMIGGGWGGLGMIIAGGALAGVGVVTLIIGAIITVVDSRRHSSTTTTTTDGGITYRKD
ncbi:MAG: hypothetical protein M3232_02340 [Thermoproteota archaeon]|nr:hypothetical protein [Thermoproteota archaeon]